MNISELCIRRPVMITLIMLGILGFGILAYQIGGRALWLKKQARAAELDARQTDPKLRVKVEPAPEVPPVDLRLETLAGVLRGDVLVQVHCYKASDIAEMVLFANDSSKPVAGALTFEVTPPDQANAFQFIIHHSAFIIAFQRR